MDAALPQTASSGGIPRSVTLLALALATFMQVLDTTIANVSIPTIAGYLGVSSDQGTWIITSFAVANGVSVPLTGWLMRRFGVVRTFVASVVLFTIASFLCGISSSMTELIMFRVLQGGVSGPIIPGSQALLLTLFPENRKGTALAIWSMTTLVAPICGPILGGYISDNYAWGWIFLINIPVGIFSSFVCWRSLPTREAAPGKLKIDGVGLALLVVWVGSLQVMLDQGKDADWFNSNLIIGLCIVTVGEPGGMDHLGTVRGTPDRRPFSVQIAELHPRHRGAMPGIRSVLWQRRAHAAVAANSSQLHGDVGWNRHRAERHHSGAGWTDRRQVHRALRSQVGSRRALLRSSQYPISCGPRTHRMRSLWVFAVPTLVQGVAMGTFFIALLTITFDGLPADKLPAASGLNNFLRITASGFATSLTTTFWDRREALHQSRLVESLECLQPRISRGPSEYHELGAQLIARRTPPC